MRRRRRKRAIRIIVDASVLRAAGETEHPISSACRETLMKILDICHHVAETKTIRLERKKHMSRFSRKWWIAMTARRKVELIETTNFELDEVLGSLSSRNEKDKHLIEGAIACDKIIVTMDKHLIDDFAGPKGKQLGLVWIVPVEDGSIAIARL